MVTTRIGSFPDRKLILGGVDIPHSKGLLGHSDGDVLLHAICDALLGAAGLGDIGKVFPDDDPQYKDISSLLLLKEVYRSIQKQGYRAVNVDATILCERPKLRPHIPAMEQATQKALQCKAINIKATTTEGMNDEGRSQCISVQATALLTSMPQA